MFCPFCGHNNAANVKFCGGCGKDLQSFTAPATPVRKVAPAKPKRERTPIRIDKAAVVKVTLQVVLALLYLGLAALLLLCMLTFGTIAVDGKGAADMTLPQFLTFLSEGNFLFHPTTLSKTLSVAVPILLYATPAFAVVAAVGVFLKQKRTSLHVAYTIVFTLAAAAQTLVAPLALWFVPHFKEALALQVMVLAEKMDGALFAPLWLPAVLVAACTVGTSILLGIVNRKKV